MIANKIFCLLFISTIAGCGFKQISIQLNSPPTPAVTSEPRYYPIFAVNGLPAPTSNAGKLSLVLPPEGASLRKRWI